MRKETHANVSYFKIDRPIHNKIQLLNCFTLRLPWDFLFKLSVKLIPLLKQRLEYCVTWRTEVEEYLNDDQNENNDIYSVDNLVPLIDASLEIISVLKLSVKKVKQDASKKRKRVRET